MTHHPSDKSIPSERLQKVLANAGFGSRRTIEEWIRAGRVTIDGKPAKLGDRVMADSQVSIDGKLIKQLKHASPETKVLIYHKPVGELTTRADPEGRPTVFDHLPDLSLERWVNIGRLDYNTSGLLLFTNNGALAHTLMHPSSEIEREYAVRVYGTVSKEVLAKLQKGVMLEDGIARFSQIKILHRSGVNQWFQVVVQEGRNRIVRRLWESQGVNVNRLMRVRFGPINLPKLLPVGEFVYLNEQELASLVAAAKAKTQSKPPGQSELT